jgi:hypothetical protein
VIIPVIKVEDTIRALLLAYYCASVKGQSLVLHSDTNSINEYVDGRVASLLSTLE